ncbi:MAG TPA: SAM-dependent methyltransferase [Lentisphaeria bacterium]|jgi:hypothetical protein|nr:SAM-dependent methyltransferase [Lentisphaeria bacterium]
MPKQHGSNSARGALQTPAAERNKGPILEVLTGVLPVAGTVLEIASGTGQHVAHFAAALPQLHWQPSDPDAELRESIRRHTAASGLENIGPPLDLDVFMQPWPVNNADAVVAINMLHVAPWPATAALFTGAATLLVSGSFLVTYGPYRRDGAHTSAGNAAFDTQLRAQQPGWGIRELEAVTAEAESAGFDRSDVVAMPANNLCLVFLRR